MTRRSCALTLAALVGRNILPGGQQGEPPRELPPSPGGEATIRVDVDLVNVLFTVRKKHGSELASRLTQNDVLVFEDGRQQVISQFSRETNLPLMLGLLVDISGSQARLIETERHAASAFFANVIRPEDEAFLMSFGNDTVLLQDFTNS
ncbi:MAG: VWA domain-containing protein, partial [Bryobacteraceae bacterium]